MKGFSFRVILIWCVTIAWALPREVLSQPPGVINADISGLTLAIEGSEQKLVRVFKNCLDPHQMNESFPISGKLKEIEGGVRFVPTVPFSFDAEYTVQIDAFSHCFKIELPEDYQRITVVRIHPSSPIVPSNLLKWYIVFDRPVNPANIYDHFSLVDDRGKVVERAFLQLENPLLSDDGRELTLWVEPGRQKRQLGPNLEMGPVFDEGKEYHLMMDGKLRDVNGVVINTGWKHSFTIGKSERSLIHPEKWNIDRPESQSLGKLSIKLDKPLDYGSVNRGLIIRDGNGKLIDGNWTSSESGLMIEFVPSRHWKSGKYTVTITSSLEDLAGNRIHRQFDQPIETDKHSERLQIKNTLSFQL